MRQGDDKGATTGGGVGGGLDIPASGGVVSDAMSYWLTAGMWQRVAKCRCVLSDSTVVAPPPNTYIHDFFLSDIGGLCALPSFP